MYEYKSEEQVAGEILSRLPPGMAKAEGSFAHLLAAGAASAICQAYHAADGVLGLICLEDGAPAEYIEAQAAEVGITRKPGTRAHCDMEIKGKPGTKIPRGALWYTGDGTAFSAAFSETVPDSGTVSVLLMAEEQGAAGNIGPGTLTTMGATIPGLISAVNGPAEGGMDPESDDALLGRLRAHRSAPAASGNASHYQAWATAAPGVGAARVLAMQDGPGTIKVVLAGPDMGPVSEDVVRAADQVVQAQKPIGPTVTVVSAGKTAVDITATVQLRPDVRTEAVKADLEGKLRGQLAATVETAFHRHVDCQAEELTGYKILYNFVLTALMTCPGVIDVTELSINGSAANLTIPADHAAVLGTVVIR